MSKTIVASKISRSSAIAVPQDGKRCFVHINNTQRVEMVYRHLKGKAKGVVWLFVCPQTGKRCLRLYLYNGLYVHRSTIKGFARLNQPPWFINSKFNKLLIIKQGQIDAQKMIDKKYFKKYYAGKPTKRYLKCLKQIEAAGGISMLGIVNGNYNNRPTSSIPQS